MTIKITMAILMLAILVFGARLALVRNLYDKLMTLNLLTIKILLFLSVYAAFKSDLMMLDIVMTSSLIGFIAAAILLIFYGRSESS